jgi:hypothetical protein
MTITLTRGDWGFDLNFQALKNDGKTPLPITGSTVRFKMLREGQTQNTINALCTITDGQNGRCKYTVGQLDLDAVGTYTAELEFTFPNKILTATLEMIEVVTDLP